ncbi:response regulator transcription factor [Pseudogracilibacillus auburnensis]|uniref:Two-component system alkaline phosphatase synthesis response regulator PhoP n=1 Tax=Pseudogracilibacillus auburnensis TaxID=1494959 RepID=A0A2V3W979_9BACI|nr:response regulator transcription factor [Pseudogracilibacillus auburnensis]MBO1004504.1 response regulator transcription factor [Pseudogracilibacillus auburnensis]PXW85289.1 two-component system alkaline phosphatase synthesis response regulator PhoP [Pseudogracilibacillus auburnensis]
MERSILIVEDEPSIVTLIKYNLEKAGFMTEVAYNGEEAIEKTQKNKFDLIVLDLMLPKMDGMEVCKTIRQNNDYIPILMLTAKDDEYDKIYGLEMGADDYLTKPFSPKELIARINAILRRTDRSTDYETPELKVGDLEVHPERFEAYFKGELLELTRKEFELLVYLAKHKGQILSREQLLNSVWEYDFVGDTRIVDVQVSHLRDKIESDTKNPVYIKTVRGFGYKMEEPT